jgi:mono/diheme cytochrome c family protein
VAEPAVVVAPTPEAIERGQYLAFGPAHCAYCHAPLEQWTAIDAGEVVPLVGGWAFAIPPGTFYTANLTPDVETGIGRYTDAQLARMLRHNVRPDGRAALPVMEFQNLSDEDVAAVIAFLRSQPPVRNAIPEHELTLMGKAIMAFLIKPNGPEGTPPARSPAEAPTVERGEYLANSVAGCAGCHSPRNMMDGSYTGPRLSGGGPMPLDHDPSTLLVPPNLTPHEGTGWITSWTEDQFLARFRAGRLIEGSHMPWPLYGRMSDDDLRALYRYLRTLDGAENATGPLVQRAGKTTSGQ